MKFRPLHDRVVVKRIDAEDKTAGGIIIPDTAKEKPSQGEITAVGPGGRDEAGKLIPIDLKVGDRVLFGKWSGTEVKIDGEELLIMKESDIMGVISDLPAARKKAKPKGTVLGQASDIPVGGGAIYTAAKVVVTQPASGQYKAFSAVCTHVGCIVNKVTNGTIDCPCHGSEFKITNGAVVTGPAPSPLPAKQIKIVDGQVILL